MKDTYTPKNAEKERKQREKGIHPNVGQCVIQKRIIKRKEAGEKYKETKWEHLNRQIKKRHKRYIVKDRKRYRKREKGKGET